MSSIFYVDKAPSMKQSESLYTQIRDTLKLHNQMNVE